MKTLTDIQVELRQLSEQIRLLTGDIEKLKPRAVDKIQQTYNEVMRLAKKYPICNKELMKALDITKKYYFHYLAMIVDQASSDGVEQLLFISRIACGIKYDLGIEEILKDTAKLKEEFLTEGIDTIGDLKYSLLLDMLIIANMTGCASTERLTYIVDLAILFQCDESDIRTLSILSSAILKNSLSEFSKIATVSDNKWSGKFLHIIPKEWLASYRVHCGTAERDRFSAHISGFSHDEIIYCVQDGTLVKKGYELLECKYRNDFFRTEKTITIHASQDGMVFIKTVEDKKFYQAVQDGLIYRSGLVEDRYIYIIYVVSSFDDYDDFCEWLKNK